MNNIKSDLDYKKSLAIKCAKCISISHIKKLLDMFNHSKPNMKVAKIFAMVINSFREKKDKVKFENLDKNNGLAQFFCRNPASLLSEIFTVITKIEKYKYNYDEICMIYRIYKLPKDAKLISLDLKPILRYIVKVKDYIDESDTSESTSKNRKGSTEMSNRRSHSRSKVEY